MSVSIGMMGLFSGLFSGNGQQTTSLKGRELSHKKKLCSSKLLYLKSGSLHAASFFCPIPPM